MKKNKKTSTMRDNTDKVKLNLFLVRNGHSDQKKLTLIYSIEDIKEETGADFNKKQFSNFFELRDFLSTSTKFKQYPKENKSFCDVDKIKNEYVYPIHRSICIES